MSWLLDVNLLLATRWATHPDHAAAKGWLDFATEFYTCPICELGFVRISLSTAYGASWHDVQQSLQNLHRHPGYRFLVDDVKGNESPETSYKNTTDAHLVALAKRHGLKLGNLRCGFGVETLGRRSEREPINTAIPKLLSRLRSLRTNPLVTAI